MIKEFKIGSSKCIGEESSRLSWMKKEPKESSDSVPHEFFQIEMNADVGIIGGSVRGKRHEHFGKWREDYCKLANVNGFSIMAVADGAGSCFLSRVGAKIACEASIQSLYEALGLLGEHAGHVYAVENCVIKSVKDAIRAVEQDAYRRNEEVKQFSTTLLLGVHARDGGNHILVCFQVGDGIVAGWSKRDGVKIIGKPDSGKWAGQSLFLTSPGVKCELRKRVTIETIRSFDMLVLMTDGLADDLYPVELRLGSLLRWIKRKIVKSKDPVRSLRSWIRYEKTGSYDDRTIAILWSL